MHKRYDNDNDTGALSETIQKLHKEVDNILANKQSMVKITDNIREQESLMSKTTTVKHICKMLKY